MDINNRQIGEKEIKNVTLTGNSVITDAVQDIGYISNTANFVTTVVIENKNWVKVENGYTATSNGVSVKFIKDQYVAVSNSISGTNFMLTPDINGPLSGSVYTLKRQNTSYILKLQLLLTDESTVTISLPTGQSSITFVLPTTAISKYNLMADGFTTGTIVSVCDRIMLVEGSGNVKYEPYKKQNVVLYQNQKDQISTYKDRMYITTPTAVEVEYNTKERSIITGDEISATSVEGGGGGGGEGTEEVAIGDDTSVTEDTKIWIDTEDETDIYEEVYVGETEDAPESAKIIIDGEQLPLFSSEVVDSLEGNQGDRAPSVRAVKQQLVSINNKLNGTDAAGDMVVDSIGTKNMLDMNELVEGSINPDNGEYDPQDIYSLSTGFIPVNANQPYTIKINDTTYGVWPHRILLYTPETLTQSMSLYSVIMDEQYTDPPLSQYTFTPEIDGFIRICFTKNDFVYLADIEVKAAQPQLEKGTTPTAYKPGQNLHIPLATTSTNGLLSARDKEVLNGLQVGENWWGNIEMSLIPGLSVAQDYGAQVVEGPAGLITFNVTLQAMSGVNLHDNSTLFTIPIEIRPFSNVSLTGFIHRGDILNAGFYIDRMSGDVRTLYNITINNGNKIIISGSYYINM